MESKKEQTTKRQERADNQQNDRQEFAADNELRAPAREAEIEEQEDFDPETANRDALLAKYQELKERLSEAEERALRAAADAENFKKRLQREKEEQTRYANEAFMRELLPVIDNLERALEHSEAESNQGGLVEGLSMTLKGFIDSLARFGCTQVKAVGKIFDPNFHEAVSQEEDANHEANTVLRQLQKGYMLKERLLRPAMVVVSKPSSPEAKAASKQAPGDSAKAAKSGVKIKVKEA